MNGLKSVIVVGAGASAEFGLPSGEGIMSHFQKWKIPENTRGPSAGYEAAMNDFYCFLHHCGPLKCDLRMGLELISRSAAGSIDLFAHHQKEYIALAKAMSTWSILRKIDKAETRVVTPQFKGESFIVDGRQVIPTVSNWLSHVARSYYGTVEKASQLDPATLTIITFNYDRLVERGLTSFISAAFPDVEAEQLPRVVHVHGAFDRLKTQRDAYEVAKQADKIRFVLETAKQRPPEIQDAVRALKTADAIYCVGFAFNVLNRELIELDQHSNKMFVLNYDGHAGLSHTLEVMRVPQDRVWRGNRSTPRGVGDAAKEGFFEQRLPVPRRGLPRAERL